jgi:hypothetical protein
MWPFKRNSSKTDPYSDYIDSTQFLASEQLRDLTPDEREEIKRAFGSLQRQRYHPNHAGDILGAAAAATLCNLATGMVHEVCQLQSDSELKSHLQTAGDAEARKFRAEAQEFQDRAIWLARKATDLYRHPILFARLAKLLQVAGRSTEVSTIQEAQKKQEAQWVPKYTDELLMFHLTPEDPPREGI